MMRGLVMAITVALVVPADAFNFNYKLGAAPNRQYSMSQPGWLPLSSAHWDTVPLISAVPRVFPNMPQGCVCLDEKQTATTCVAFICQKTCDLHKGQCDSFCCSDPDCTAAEVERFKSTGMCLDDGSENNRVQMCTDTSTLDKVNVKYNMYDSSDDDPLNGLLCVSINNDPYDGSFYAPQTNLINNVALMDSPRYRPESSFQPGSAAVTSSSSPFYLFGSAVTAATTLSNGSLQAVWGGFLSLPTVGPNGECVSTNFVQFGEFVQDNQCVQPLGANLTTTCSDKWGALSVQALTQGLRLGATPLSSLSSNTVGDWIVVDTGSVSYKDPMTGEITLMSLGPTTDAPSKAPTVAQVPVNNGRLLGASDATITTTWNAGTSTCANAIVGARFRISHDSDGVISAASVDVTVSDLVMPSPTVSPPGAVMQKFQVDFINVNTSSSAKEPSIVPRVVSGNPGYIQGFPVQAGNLTSQDTGDATTAKSAIEYGQSGLTIMAAIGAKGRCFSGNSSAWWTAMDTKSTVATPVQFGVDAVSTCSVQLSYSNFRNMSAWCKDWSSAPIFQLPFSHVGVFGNADPLNTWEWVPINEDLASLVTTKQSPLPGALMCENIVDRVDIEILWTKSGQTSNPQPMILCIRKVLRQNNWRWRKTMQADAMQTFTFSHSVTFIEHKLADEDTTNYKPEVGAILPQVSFDIFYPFDIDSGSSKTMTNLSSLFLLSFMFVLIGF